ncbi:MAG: hypothetical protein ACE5JZ_02130 [Kiloniellales bacterium]
MTKRLVLHLLLACGAAVMAAAAVLGPSPAKAFKIVQSVYDSYDPFEMHYAGDDRDFWTVVLGNPFPAPKPVVDSALTAAMATTRWGKRTNFTTTPDDSARRVYRIVMLLNGNTLTGYRICGYYPDRPLGPGAHDGKIHVVATFCRGQQPLSQAVGSTDAATPNDPEFRKFVRQLMANLLPTHNPQRPRGDPIRIR